MWNKWTTEPLHLQNLQVFTWGRFCNNWFKIYYYSDLWAINSKTTIIKGQTWPALSDQTWKMHCFLIGCFGDVQDEPVLIHMLGMMEIAEKKSKHSEKWQLIIMVHFFINLLSCMDHTLFSSSLKLGRKI